MIRWITELRKLQADQNLCSCPAFFLPIAAVINDASNPSPFLAQVRFTSKISGGKNKINLELLEGINIAFHHLCQNCNLKPFHDE